jgi:hypothetical protein
MIYSVTRNTEHEDMVLLFRDIEEMDVWEYILTSKVPLIPSPAYKALYTNSTSIPKTTSSTSIDMTNPSQSTSSMMSDTSSIDAEGRNILSSPMDELEGNDRCHSDGEEGEEEYDEGFGENLDGIENNKNNNNKDIKKKSNTPVKRFSPVKYRKYFQYPPLPPTKPGDRSWIRTHHNNNDDVTTNESSNNNIQNSISINEENDPGLEGSKENIEYISPKKRHNASMRYIAKKNYNNEYIHDLIHPITGLPIKYNPPKQLIPKSDKDIPLAKKRSGSILICKCKLLYNIIFIHIF